MTTEPQPTTVITYRLAYLDRRVTLCDRCANDPGVIEAVGVLGPVEHGARRGYCDADTHHATTEAD